MKAPAPLSEESYRFRRELLERLDRYCPIEKFFYIEKDVIVAVCPLCDKPLTVRFAGAAPRATLECRDSGCEEIDIAAALRKARAR